MVVVSTKSEHMIQAEYHVDEEAAKKWLANGAQPTDTVARIFKATGITK